MLVKKLLDDYLKSSGLTDTKGFKRLVIEKPFGSDLKSAEALNNQIRKSFKEEEIYRKEPHLIFDSKIYLAKKNGLTNLYSMVVFNTTWKTYNK